MPTALVGGDGIRDENARAGLVFGVMVSTSGWAPRSRLVDGTKPWRHCTFPSNGDKVLSSKKNGGLEISSFYASNRALLFKWVWRFFTQESSWRSRFIKVVLGNQGVIDSRIMSSRGSPWLDIIRDLFSLKSKGIDLMQFIRKKIGNGENTSFWNDPWLDSRVLKFVYPRAFALESCNSISVASNLNHPFLTHSFRRLPRGGVEEEQVSLLRHHINDVILPNMSDRWIWSLDGSGLFSVKSARRVIDNTLLPKVDVPTRWVKIIPIKVNIHAWRVCLDKIPTRLNLSIRGIDIPSILCPLCNTAVESTSRIFFSYPLARQVRSKVMRWWELDDISINGYGEWLSWLVNSRLPKHLKTFLEGLVKEDEDDEEEHLSEGMGRVVGEMVAVKRLKDGCGLEMMVVKKQVTFEEQCIMSKSNTHKPVEQLNCQKTNVPVPPSTGVNSCTDASRSQPRSNTKKNRILSAKSVNMKKVEEHPRTIKSSLKTTNRVDSSISSKHTVINSNSHSVCQTCNKCLISANHDMCVVTYLHSVNASPSVKNVVRKVKQVWKPKQVKQVWKPTGNILTTVGYQWMPTGRTFTLGEQCPLTRLTKPNKVSAIAYANPREPNHNWGSNFPNSPSSSVFKCRSYRSSFGIWTQAVQNI
ncbi:RNA-directed DNA polymerase, eukaryota, reverse transcriptase zinc-binding domain protein [Tanacetum coccineum]